MSENISIDKDLSREEKYMALLPQLSALVEGTDLIADCGNIMAAVRETFSFFWVGMYFVKYADDKEKLVLGPFQGSPACVTIDMGKGVCGTAWLKKETIIVSDVNEFPGHIACSPFSKSEIVVPVIKNDVVRAVIDIDSDVFSDFDLIDKKYLEQVALIISGIL